VEDFKNYVFCRISIMEHDTIKTQEYKVVKHKILYKKGIRYLSVKQIVLHEHSCRKIFLRMCKSIFFRFFIGINVP